MTVVIHDRQRRAGAPAGSFASEAGRAIFLTTGLENYKMHEDVDFPD